MGKIGKKVKYRLLSFGIIPFLAAAAFLIIFFGQAHYFNELERVKGHAEKELLSIGRLKIREIAAWYRERLDDGAYIKSDPILAGHLKDLMEEQAPEERDKVIEWMASVKEDLGYMGVLLVDRDLKKVVSVPEEEDFTHIGRKMLQEAFFTGEVVFSDLHKYGGEGYVHLDMVVPLKAPGKTEIIGGLFFRIDPWKVLFPFLDEWPTTSASGENMLVSLRDGHVLYLNGTKFSKDIPPLGTSSQGEEIIISAMGSGRSGVVVEGEDYRGERVLAGVYSIPGTSWYFVCKKDLKEIYFPVSGELRWIILFMFLLAVSILSMLAVTVQTARIRIKRNEYESRIKGLVLEKQYNLLSRYANDAIILINEDLTILQANDRAAGCYGYPVSKLVGMTLWSLRAPEERAKIRTQFEKIDTLAGATYETKHLKKDGTVFPVEISTRMIDIEGEKFYQSIIRDISGQKSAERIIREREKDLKTLLEAANSVIIRWRPDGTIIFINDLGRRKFGYEKGELEGKNVMTLVPRVDSAGRDIGDLAAKIAADPERYEFVDNENIGKNGERLWLSWSNKAINYDDGRLKEMLSIGNDITERRKAEETLRMSIAEWDATFNASHDSIMLIGKDRRVMKANLAASKMLDRATGNVVGKHCNELMSVLGVGPEFFPIKKVLESRKSEGSEIAVGGEGKIWLEISVDPVFDGSGEISSFVHTVKDITEKKKDEEELFNLAEVVKHSAELVILAACDGTIMFINDAGAEMLGIDPLDPGKSKIMDFIPDDLKAKVRREIFLPMCREDIVWQGDLRYTNAKTGKTAEVYAMSFGIRDKKTGEIRYFASIALDVTRQKALEKAHKESEARFREIFESMSSAVAIYEAASEGEDFVFKDVNKALCRIENVSKNDVLGKSLREVFPGVEEFGILDVIKRVFRTGTPERLPVSLYKDVRISGWRENYICKLPSGEVVAVYDDVTERKKDEEEREAQRRFLRQTIDAIPAFVCVKDMWGRYLLANKELAGAYGTTIEVLEGRCDSDFSPAADEVSAFLKDDMKVISGKETVRIPEEKITFADGSVHWLSTIKTPIIQKDGSCTSLLAVAMDITERRKAEEELKKIEWMLLPGKVEGMDKGPLCEIGHGDLTALNKDGLILKNVGKELLADIANDYLALLGTSSAIYEKNGDYAFGIFSSKWCRHLDKASRNLCDARDDAQALRSGKWLCHESCWTEAAKRAIETGQVIDVPCNGGIFLYTVPIIAREEVIGAINFGYGDPPKDPQKLKELAVLYRAGADDLAGSAEAYDSRPKYIIEMAKIRLAASARLIGAIVEMRLAEEALAGSEKKFHDLFYSMNEMVVLHEMVRDASGRPVDYRIIDCNPAFSRVTGISRDEAVGKPATLVYETDHAPYLDVYSRVTETGIPERMEVFFEPLKKYFSVSVFSPAPEKFATIALDLTDRMKAQEELIESHKRLLSVLDASISPVYVADPDTYELLYVNKALEASVGAVCHKKCYEQLQGRSEPCPFCTNDKIFGPDLGKIYQWEFRNEVNGRWYWCVDRAITWIDGRFVRYEMATDITKRKNAEEELARHKDHLEEIVKDRTEELESFSYSVSHDLRAPLRAIAGFSSVLKEDFASKLGEEGCRILDVVIESTENMRSLIDDLLAFSRLGRRNVEVFPVDMVELAGEVTKEVRLTEPSRNVQFILKDMPSVVGDRAMLKQVFVNLVSNAVKFTRPREKAVIEIGSRTEKNEYVYYVKDNGVGFDMKYVSKLFGVFQRLHGAGEFEGTGVGLAIVKRVISKHGGRVWAESEVNKGATFFFSLPKKKE